MTTDFEINTLPYGSEASNGILFKVGIRNIFDETFDEKPYINGDITIWLEPDEFIRKLTFHIEDKSNLTLDPQKTAFIEVYWDQKDKSGQPIWKRLKLNENETYDPLNFKASARIKFYKNIPYIYSDTLRFTVQYDTSKNMSSINFLAVEMTNLAHCWISGTEGTIYVSYDSLKTFQKQITNTTVNLNDIEFLNNSTGWCVGDNGTILHTGNGGENWQQIETSFNNNLNRIFFITEDFGQTITGWIVGDDGLILNTTDGGNSWIKIESNTEVNLYGVYFYSRYYGFVAGELGTILKTTDAGNRWTVYRRQYTNCFKDLYLEGYTPRVLVAGSEGFIKTFDSENEKWYGDDTGLKTGINRMFFVNKYRGWAAGNKGTIVFIRQWNRENPYMVQMTNSKNCINDIKFINSTTGIAVGDGETIFFTTSGDVWLCIRNYHIVYRMGIPSHVPNFKINLNRNR